jgi:hypothetical protein
VSVKQLSSLAFLYWYKAALYPANEHIDAVDSSRTTENRRNISA